MQEMEVPEYLTHVEKRLQEENDRVLHYLDSGTKYVFGLMNRNNKLIKYAFFVGGHLSTP